MCVVYCSQTLSNGNFIEYEEGTVITSTDASGTTRKFKCVNGQWVQQASLVSGAGLAWDDLSGRHRLFQDRGG